MDAAGTTLQPILILLAAAVLAVVACRLFALPPILGYLAVGLALGPQARWARLPTTRMTQPPRRIRRGVPHVLDRPGIQPAEAARDAARSVRPGLWRRLLLTIAACVALVDAGRRRRLAVGSRGRRRAWRCPPRRSSPSCSPSAWNSTRAHGRSIIGVLLFQDLAVVPLLILIPVLGAARGRHLARRSRWRSPRRRSCWPRCCSPGRA